MTAASIVTPFVRRVAQSVAGQEGVEPRDVLRRWLVTAATMAALRVSPRLTGRTALPKAA